MRSTNWQERLSSFHKKVSHLNKTFIGYPTNAKFSWKEINQFLSFTLNNAGDPFGDSHYQMNSHEFEREVVYIMGKLMGLASDEVWGYVTNGGTEGNLEGLWLARERFPNAVVFYSKDTHYSISKIVKILNLEFVEIPSQDNGEINYQIFEKYLDKYPDRPVIVVANFGTTMKGAIDNLDYIQKILNVKKVKEFYIHVDAALFGMISQLLSIENKINFQTQNIDSVAISGHKFIGSPIPSGLILTRKSNVETVNRSIEYVGILDTTITGSRNAITPIIWWLALHKYGLKKYSILAQKCINTAKLLKNKIADLGLNSNINAFSNIVWFDKPSPEICHKWQLATSENIAHVIVMPHVDSGKIARFLVDLKKSHSNS